VLYEVIQAALGIEMPWPEVVCVGMAGMDRAEDREVVGAILRRLGCRGQVLAVNDALVALVAGADEDPGVVVVAGTGSIAYGVGPTAIAARAGGWGEVYGDEGSAFWVGKLALAAVVRASDRRGPQTALTPLVLRHAGTERIDGLVAQVYARPDRRQAIAAMAGLVARADADGDAVAREILSAAGAELALAARSVVEQLAMRGERFRVVLSGGLFKMAPTVASMVAQRIAEIAPRAATGVLTDEPALGAVRLALRAAEGRLRLPVYAAAPARA
jgi:N-acetylglucosamine kinase-like BadF-type ATPase